MKPAAVPGPTGGPLLLYEPRTEGHHLAWLRYLVEDFLSAGVPLAVAVDQRPTGWERLRGQLGQLLDQVAVVPAIEPSGRRPGGARAAGVAHCLRAAAAAEVLLGSLDEIASSCLRRAAVGLMPPRALRGRLGGIYHRPRFLAPGRWSLNRSLKRRGFNRLMRDGWFRRVLLLDEYLYAEWRAGSAAAPVHFLPTPCPNRFTTPTARAREQLGVPADQRVFLFYGGAYRRKGLPLAAAAMQRLPPEVPAFLLCAGQQPPDRALAAALAALTNQGRALVLDRYLSTAEEELCFCASDVVLLPYLHHFGSSGVLSQAVTAGKMVIVSDEGLLGRRTRDHQLGLVFPPGDLAGLEACLREAAQMPAATLGGWSVAATRYAAGCTRQAFRAALLDAFGLAPQATPATGPVPA